jgi:hypothetical protein
MEEIMTTRKATGVKRMSRRVALFRSVAGLLLAVLLSSLPQAQAQGGKPGEYDIKAAFIYNFLKYVEFPAQSFPAGSTTLAIGVLGKDPFGGSLNALTKKSIQGRSLVIKRFTDVKDIGDTHVLFISSSEKARLKPILDAVKSTPVLTIGEVGGFAKNGGIINFTIENNNVRFEVNPDAAERAKLKISSQLLRLAKVIKP